MLVESQQQKLTYAKAKTQTLAELLLLTLEQYDGLCLDNTQERATLATALVNALIGAAADDSMPEINLPQATAQPKPHP